MMWRHMGPGGFGAGGLFVGVIACLLFFLIAAAIAVGIVALVRRSRGMKVMPAPHAEMPARAEVPADDPLRILQLRYAKGEITQEQYQAMREDLKT